MSESANDPEALEAALASVKTSPDDPAAWERLEEVAAEAQRPDPVAELYVEVLTGDLAPRVAESVAQRAVHWIEEWFGEDNPVLVQVLDRVLAVDPSASWAFQRLTVVHTTAGRWDDLLALYDRTLGSVTDAARRAALLDEAANAAKDFAGNAVRAIAYMQELLPLRPNDAQLASSLERLLEREERWEDLIAFWNERLQTDVEQGAARDMRVRIADTFLGKLDRPADALEEVERLLQHGGSGDDPLRLLEAVSSVESAPAQVQRRALALLRERYAAEGRGTDVVRTLDSALLLADQDEAIALRREAGQRLVEQGGFEEAIGHYAALLGLDPTARDALEQLRELARRLGAHGRQVQALRDAADACQRADTRIELRLEAADVMRTSLEDVEGAIGLYRQILAEPKAGAGVTLTVARRLNDLFTDAGRMQDRLEVLERLATIEPDAGDRRNAIGQAARAADGLGDPDRALATWKRRIDEDPHDLEALAETIGILERGERWEPLVDALRQRAAAPVPPLRRRRDLLQIARVQENELERIDDAITTWTAIADEFGEEPETVDALADLLSKAGRWEAVSELLGRAADREADHVATIYSRIGDVQRAELASPRYAAEAYASAVRIDPGHTGARAGLRRLLEDDSCRGIAAEALALAYGLTDEWAELLSLLEHRLTTAERSSDRVRLLREAASIQEHRAEEPAQALASMRRAMELAPELRDIEADVFRLAEATGDWQVAVEAIRAAVEALGPQTPRARYLRFCEGKLTEAHLDDPVAALSAYGAVFDAEPQRVDAAVATVRTAGRCGRWDRAASVLLRGACGEGVLGAEIREAAEAAADAADAWDALTSALESHLLEAGDLPGGVGRALECLVADWHQAHRDDADAAQAALSRAVGRDDAHVETLKRLAVLRRRSPGRPLFETLIRLADLLEDDLDPLREAAELTVPAPEGETPGGPVLDDPDAQRATLERLYREAGRHWRRHTQTTGRRGPEECARWALDRLVEVHERAGAFDLAVAVLSDASHLPVDGATSRELRRRAAAIAAAHDDRARAIVLYQGILDEDPRDRDTLAQLAAVCEAQDRLPEMMALRQRELALTEEPDRRLQIRLDLARIVGELERRGGRVESLLENLAERPGHVETLDAIEEVLRSAHRFGELSDVLGQQGGALEAEGEAARAALLWAKVASIAEGELADVQRAVAAHRRVVELAATPEALDSLARLHTDRGEHAAAAQWLERRLAGAEPEARPDIALCLARAHLGAEQPGRAIATLEVALAEHPERGEIREMLAQRYREAGALEPLARLLTEAAPHVEDPQTVLLFAREAADLYDRLGTPERAIAILEKAAKASPDQRDVRTRLAVGLRLAERHDEAREILEEVIESYGRRRNAERGAVHYQLAQVARAQGDMDGALEQLGLASRMDASNPVVLRALAEAAHVSGDAPRAERAYRALLLIVRRQQGDADAPVGASEVQYELYRIAKERGDDEQAGELLESAVEAATSDDVEVRRLERTLLRHGEGELALRILDKRLGLTEDAPAQAALLSGMAEVLDRTLDRGEEALRRALEAMSKAPEDAGVLDAARDLARRREGMTRYVQALEEAADAAARRSDSALLAALLLRAGAVAEEDLADLERAARSFRRVAEVDARRVDGWQALARVSAARGEVREELRVLEMIVGADEEAVASTVRVDAMYRLAEVRLGRGGQRHEGLEVLVRALERDPRNARAAAMLRDATSAAPGDEAILSQYEMVARQGGDPDVLLDFLEKRAARPDATLGEVREGVELASARREEPRAERLLERAAEVASASEDGLGGALWVPMQLADLRKAAGDVAGAVRWMSAAAQAADEERSFGLWLEAAGFAGGDDGDLGVAVEVYSRLYERDPDDRRVWEPYLSVLRRSGAEGQLADLAGRLIDGLLDPDARNAVRMQQALYLLSSEGREADAADVLRAVLDEEPEHPEGAKLLADLYERTGYDEDLVDLLERQFDIARDREELDIIRDTSLRLGSILEKVRREDAVDAYRRGLEWLPHDRRLVQALLAQLSDDDDPREKVEVTEKLLDTETGEDAARLAMDLASRWEQLDEPDSVARVLALGYRGCPEDEALRERLQDLYRDQERWQDLAELMTSEALRLRDPALSVELARQASSLYLDTLSDPAGAARALAVGIEVAPRDVQLLAELARCRAAAGEHDAALAELSAALQEHPKGPDRVALLRVRAQIRLASGRDVEALEDLEEAYGIAGPELGPDLVAALRHRRARTAESGDAAHERFVTLRLAQVLASLGGADEARDVLAEWVGRAPDDLEALHTLRDIDEAAGRWEGLAATCARLIEVEQEGEQVDAALRLADAWERAGDPESARQGLEYVNAVQPTAVVRDRLRKLYERTGAHHELGALLLQDANETTGADAQYQLLRLSGDHFLKAGDPAAAVGPLQAAIGLRPDDHPTTILIVDCHIADERFADAGQILEQAIASHTRRRSPELSELQHRMARLAEAAGDRDLQLQWLNAALDSDKSSGHVAAELARLAMALGEHDAALSALRVVTLNKTEGPMSRAMAFLLQAQIAHQRGEARRALLWARKAKSEDPELEEAQEFLRQIGDG